MVRVYLAEIPEEGQRLPQRHTCASRRRPAASLRLR